MRALDHFEVPILIPMIKEVQAACGQANESDVDYCLSQMSGRIQSKQGAVFVDTVDSPGAVAVLYVGDSPFKPGKICHVMLVYVKPALRTPALADHIIQTCLDFSKSSGCFQIYGSSWEFQGVTAGIGSAWERFGFEKQETIYRKKF